MIKATKNIVEQVCLWDSGASFGYMCRNGIGGYAQFSEKLPNDFQNGRTSLQIFDLSHFGRSKMESQSHFDLHFPDD